jgi:hypothetical protein
VDISSEIKYWIITKNDNGMLRIISVLTAIMKTSSIRYTMKKLVTNRRFHLHEIVLHIYFSSYIEYGFCCCYGLVFGSDNFSMLAELK